MKIRKPPRPPSVKIEAKDKKNWSPVHVKFDEECVIIQEDSFGEPDVEKMVVLSNDQWQKLKRLNK